MNILQINNPVFKCKIASFDYDWTIVSTIKGNTFSTRMNDWNWLYPKVPNKIIDYYNRGYMIVIFTNQSKLWKQTQIMNVMKLLKIPVYIVIGSSKSHYKPNKLLFDLFIQDVNKLNEPIDLNNSFYVGDAIGRKCDFSDSDKIFALNIGIKLFSPEEFFFEKYNNIVIPSIPLVDKQEIIVMMGYPASGKSTLAKYICDICVNYKLLERDIYNTVPKMLKLAKKFINENKSVIFDATNGSKKNRKLFIDFSNQCNTPIKCIHVNTSLLESLKRNKLREPTKQVPNIAYSVYSKYYEPPDESEGFELISLSF
jgi:bifunctional polynucleotide phosphatase/kinase